MLNRLFGRMLRKKRTKKRKSVSCDELSRVLNSVTKPGEGSALGGCVQWVSGIDGDIVFDVGDLEIEVAYNSRDKAYDEPDEVEIRYGLSSKSVSLRFENCCFLWSDNSWTGIKFVPNFIPEFRNPHEKSFSFFGNTERGLFSSKYRFPFSFSFPGDSQVVFEQNDFTDIIIKRNGGDDNDKRKGVFLEFKKNKIRHLNLDFPFPFEYPINCRFVGNNEVDIFTWHQVVNRYDDVKEYNLLSISFSRNEKIGKMGYSRELFVRLRNLAHVRGDIGQESIIASYIFQVEYARVKDSKWYKSWRGWQDWLLLGWRKWSSDFYMSWVRPFGCLIGGYLVFNAIPFLGIDSDFGDKVYGWLEFSFYSPVKIPFYAEGLKAVLDAKKLKLGEGWGGWLHFIGFLRLLWIALWGYAFRNAIRTFSSR